MRLYLLTLIALLIAANCTRAAQPSDDAIAPWIGPFSPVVVIYFDLDRIDENTLGNALLNAIKDPAFKEPERQLLQGRFKQWLKIGDGPMADFHAAGIRRVYRLVTLSEIVDPDVKTRLWILPLEGNTDAQKVIEIAHEHHLAAERNGQVVTATTGQSLAAGDSRELPPAWEHALGGGGDWPIRAAIVPPESLRKSFEENLPSLPTPAGAERTTVFTRGVEWIALSATLAPQPQLRMTVKSPDAAAAEGVANSLRRMLPKLQSLPQQYAPLYPVQYGPLSRLLLQPVVVQALKPTVVGDQLRWEPDFKSGLALIIARDLCETVRVRSASKMRTILQYFSMYVHMHNEQTAPDLNAIVNESDVMPDFLVDPLNPSEKVGYAYIRPNGDWQKSEKPWLVLYETAPYGFLAGFTDGHVEWLDTRAQVEEQVKITEARNHAAK